LVVTLSRCYYHQLASAALGVLLLIVVFSSLSSNPNPTLLLQLHQQQQQQQQPFRLEEVLLLVEFGVWVVVAAVGVEGEPTGGR